MIHTLVVEATDLLLEAGGAQPGTAMVVVTVNDTNDNIPMFNQTQYNATVIEGSPIGTFVLRVFAIDPDSALHSQLVFSITGEGSSDFSIEGSGVIITAGDIDRERRPSYSLNVSVSNPGSMAYGLALVFIDVQDQGDNLPMITLSPASAILIEPETILQLSTNLAITDEDASPSLEFANVTIIGSVTPGSLLLPYASLPAGIALTGNGTKQLDISGLSSLSVYEMLLRSILYQDESAEPLSVSRLISYRVFGGGLHSFESYFIVSVMTINDNEPVISLSSNEDGSFNASYKEDDPPVLITNESLSITDLDSGVNMISYAVVELLTSPDGVQESLSVSISRGLTRDTQSTAQRLIIRGPGTNEDFRVVLRTIRYSTTSQSPAPTTRQVSFLVNDGLLNSSLVYSFIDVIPVNDIPVVMLVGGGGIDNAVFYVEGQSSAVVLAPSLSIQDVDSTLLISALVSLSSPTNEEQLNISLIPPGLTLYSSGSELYLNATTGGVSVGAFVSALRTVTYYSTRQVPFSSSRMITFIVTDDSFGVSSPAVSRVVFNSTDDQPQLDLNGLSIDGMNTSLTYTEGDPAINVAPNASIVDVDSPNATSLTITITALYFGDHYTFPMIPGLYKTNNSDVHVTYSGSQPLSVYEALIRNISFADTNEEPLALQPREISFIIYTPISGNGGSAPSNVATATIQVVPVNDQAPVFDQSSYSGQVNENSLVNTSVGVSVAASDGDLPSNQITYYISGKDADQFTIDQYTGVVLTAAVFDAEMTTSLSFNVTAEDSYGSVVQSNSVPVSIVIADVNDNVPVFDLPFYQLNVSEKTSVGNSLLTVSASDSDVSSINSALTYSLSDIINMSGSGQSLLPFAINPSTGVITLTRALDYETEQMFDFIVTCQDSGTPSLESSVPVTINVADANDNAPIFSQDVYTAAVSENTSFGSTILTIQARDIDSGSNSHIIYEITGTVTFIIDATSGVISLVGGLDYETETSIVFNVLARDSGIQEQVSTAVVNINVTNVNDNTPSFLNQVYNFDVYENTTEPQFTVLAQDPDNENEVLNPLTYSILSSCLSDAVAISSGDGVLSLLQPFDRESLSNCVLVVGVSDGLHSSNVTVNMRILDINDNQPSFTQSMYTESIPEIYPIHTFVTTVTALDPDEGENGTVNYAIVGGNVGGAFSIAPSSGMITVNASLDHEMISSYNLTLIARDGGGLTGTSHVLITVTDNNDESPILVISQSSYTYAEETGLIAITSSLQLIEPDILQNNIEEALIILSVETSCQDDEHTAADFACPPDFDCFHYCSEGLALNKSLYNSLSVSYTTDVSTINISGAASPATYESLLSSLHYFNGLSEPLPGNRMVELSVFDGVHHSNTLAINITVSVIDDNCPVITSSLSQIDFTEGDHSLDIGLGLGLMLTDSDQHDISHQIISGVQITPFDRNGVERLTVNTTGLPLTVEDITLSNGQAIRISGPASIVTYQNVLRTLRYENSVPEPTKGLRLGSITLLSEQCPMYNLNYSINVITVNDNAPMIATNATMVEYREGSGSSLIARLVDFTLTDLDTDFPIRNATLILTPGDIRDDGHETLTLDTGLIPAGVNFDASGGETQLSFTGPSSVSNYQDLIRSLSYSNTASEPTPGNRTLTITVSDGVFTAQTTLTIRVLLVNDNPLQLNGSVLMFPFYEGNTTIVLYGFLLYDPDEGTQVHSLNISLSGSLEIEKEEISVTAFGNVIRRSHTISLTIVDSISTYQAILDTLSYSYTTINDSEPLPGPRELTITATNGAFPPSSVSTIIAVELINNNPPLLSFGGIAEAVYTETAGSATVLPIGAINQPMITDDDNNEIFFIHEATVRLVGPVDGASERLNLSVPSLPNGLNATVTPHSITISGPAPLVLYQQLLSTITYTNTEPEPSLGNRSIQYTVHDGLFSSNTIQSMVSVSLINEHPLILTCNGQTNQFTEGSGDAIVIGPSVSVSDLDSDHVIRGADVMIVNGFNGDTIGLSNSTVGGLHATVVNGTSLSIEGNGTAAEYQSFLHLLRFYNNEEEPTAAVRQVHVTLYQPDPSTAVNCSIIVNMILINDHIPIVDLNGLENGINYTTSIVSQYQAQNQVLIADAENSYITDSDSNSIILSMNISLVSSTEGDAIVSDVGTCGMSTPTGTCYLNIFINSPNCSCGTPVPSNLNVSITPTSLSFTQSGSLPSLFFQNLLRDHIHFRPSSSRANGSSAVVMVTVSDGSFVSEPAYSFIDVTFSNNRPSVLINGELSGNVSMIDGQTVLEASTSVVVSDDSNMISQISIRLLNPVHTDTESISVMVTEGSGITLNQSNTTHILLEGMSSSANYNNVLRTLTYSYSRMSSLLESQPNVFEDRYIAIVATDNDGALSLQGTLIVTFNRTCTVYSMGSTIKVPSKLSSERLTVCTAISGLTLEFDGIANLSSLVNVQSLSSLTIENQPDLTSLKGLENLESINELVIINVPNLVSLEALGANLPSDYRTNIHSIGIHNDLSLVNLDGLRIFENVTNVLSIQNCPQLRDLSGTNNIVFAETIILNGISMPTITSFTSLYSVGSIWFYRNTPLRNITGFNSLRSAGMINIIQNPSLYSIDGLSGVQSVNVVRSFFNPNLCYIGTGTPNQAYWQQLGASTMGDFVTATCPSRTCTSTPCLNDGTCMDTSDFQVPGNYMCLCSGDYFGSSCQYFNVCTTDPCMNNGTCSVSINAVTVNQFICQCPPGFTDADCSTPVCLSDSCDNGGTCDDSSGSLVCMCPSGYTGDRCQTSLS